MGSAFRMSWVWPLLPSSSPSALVWATIIPHSDYGRILLTGLPTSALTNLQVIFHKVVRVVPLKLSQIKPLTCAQASNGFPSLSKYLNCWPLSTRSFITWICIYLLVLSPTTFHLVLPGIFLRCAKHAPNLRAFAFWAPSDQLAFPLSIPRYAHTLWLILQMYHLCAAFPHPSLCILITHCPLTCFCL